MIKALAVAAALAFPLMLATPALAQAPSCTPLDSIVEEAEGYGLEIAIVLEDQQQGFVEAYTVAIGKPVPQGIEVVGLMFGVNEHGAYVGLIEMDGDEYCIRLSTTIPLATHELARGVAGAGT